MKVQEVYLGYSVGPKTPGDFLLTAQELAAYLRKQICDIEVALVFFGLWLIAYLLWWVVNPESLLEGK